MSQKVARKGAAKAEVSASVVAVDELRKRIATEAELIVQELMPKKVRFCDKPNVPRQPIRRACQ